MKLRNIGTAVMATFLMVGSAALALADPPQATLPQNQTQKVDRDGRTILKPNGSQQYRQDLNATSGGEPGTVDRAVVVSSDGTTQVELIVHPRYDDSAFRK